MQPSKRKRFPTSALKHAHTFMERKMIEIEISFRLTLNVSQLKIIAHFLSLGSGYFAVDGNLPLESILP